MNRSLTVVCGVLLLLAFSVRAESPKLSQADRDAQALAAKIDKHLAEGWKKRNVKPAPATDDAEFLRRLFLDLGGRVPVVYDIIDFLDNDSKDKRWEMIQELLEGKYLNQYVEHFTAFWRRLFLSETNPQFAFGLDPWVRQKVKENPSFDKWVRELLTTQPVGGAGPGSYYQANEFKPENLASSTSRLFLGVRLECAQCHDHPFASWTRKQFWEYAAFFSNIRGPQRGGGRQPEPKEIPEITIAGTDRVVQAKFLDGVGPKFEKGVDPRTTLADWMLSRDNPFFARAIVNRLWAYFFGIGITEPVDEPSEQNPPSHPELLDELAKDFAAHDFDLKYLIKAIVFSKGYQLTSVQTDASQVDGRAFARMAVRGLTPEQLFDSLALATGYRDQDFDAGPQPRGQQTARNEFLSRFVNNDKRTETQTSILQALYLMNGRVVTTAMNLGGKDNNLKQIVTQDTSTARKIVALYLVTVSRKPRPEETERLVKYVDSGGPTGDHNKALTDVYWALLNSAEFYLNH